MVRDYDKFQRDLDLAQSGDMLASERILRGFMPLIRKYRYFEDAPDDDLFSELLRAALFCISNFRRDESDMEDFLRKAGEILGKG
jgi:hypothetical protein